MKDNLRLMIRKALDTALERGELLLAEPPTKIEVSRTKDPRFGDYATNLAMTLAGPARKAPKLIAEVLVGLLKAAGAEIKDVQVAGPGFINLFLSDAVWRNTLREIHEKGADFGKVNVGEGKRVLLEFVSANPTGPLHVGHGRGAAVGDTLARLLRACGYDVKTEYYVNDAGNQMRILGRSLLVRYRQRKGIEAELPENHYRGEYMMEIAERLENSALGGHILNMSEEEALEAATVFAYSDILDGIREDLAFFGVQYDNWFSERELHASGAVQGVVDELRTRGRAELKEGAVWFTVEGDEDEKDRVLVRASGEPTYFAADAAYHENKLHRGFELLVDIWGSDHHGYVPRVKAAMEALGGSPEALKVLLVQFVVLLREGKKISMSTRSGEFVTLREVLNEVGPDAARFFFLTKRSDSHLDFDLELAKKQSRDNPVYYVQYAHARVSSIFRIAAERGIDVDMSNPDLALLTAPEEYALIKRLADYPDMLADAAKALEPHRVTFYLLELSELLHAYYHDNRVLLEDEGLKKARLYLIEAVRIVIAEGLRILGVSAPERM
jgi:arginyl-tRNA synthetase